MGGRLDLANIERVRSRHRYSSEVELIPAWKLKRELARIGNQILGLPHAIRSLPSRLSEPRVRREHDAAFPSNLKITEGCIPPSEKIAVVVLYQPGGLAPSTFDTCRGLAGCGYAPLVMSNAPLSEDDRAELVKACWRVVERPNFGYDFGAYRDGIRLIRAAKLSPDRLVLINDSIWCEITDALLSRMEALDADLAGLLQDEKVRHDTSGGTPTDRRHIESYFLMVSAHLWRSRAFHTFWDGYRMTDYKPTTIKTGEIGFSRAMKEAGFRLDALTNRNRFLEGLSDASEQELIPILRHAAYDDASFRSEGQALLECSKVNRVWKEKVLDHIRRWVNRRRFYAAFPMASARIFNVVFIKKSREPIYVEARAAYLRSVEAGNIPAPSTKILEEIRAWESR